MSRGKAVRKLSIAQAIAQQQKASIVRTLGSADEVLEQMWRLATYDANQLSRSIAAGAAVTAGASVTNTSGAMLLSTKRSDSKRLSENVASPSMLVATVEHTSAPNPECPRCNGDGVGQPFFADTRKLAPDAALAYSGVKLGKNGVEITSISRERMYEACDETARPS